MQVGARSALPDSTIVDASSRFARSENAESFDLDRNLAAVLVTLMSSDGQLASISSSEAAGLTPVADAPRERGRSYLDTLEMISSAAEAMLAMESHSQRIQAKACEIAERARYDVTAAQQESAALRDQLAENAARIESLERSLQEAEERAQTAQQWLTRFEQAASRAFSASGLGKFRRPTGQ